MEDYVMKKIDKMDAFELVVKAIENGDENTANEIMKIITKSISKEKGSNKFSLKIEVNGKKEERYFKELLDEKIKEGEM